MNAHTLAHVLFLDHNSASRDMNANVEVTRAQKDMLVASSAYHRTDDDCYFVIKIYDNLYYSFILSTFADETHSTSHEICIITKHKTLIAAQHSVNVQYYIDTQESYDEILKMTHSDNVCVTIEHYESNSFYQERNVAAHVYIVVAHDAQSELFYAQEFDTLSKAFADLHRFNMSEYAASKHSVHDEALRACA